MAGAAGAFASYYHEIIAQELDSIAESIRKSPHLNGHFATRLNELAKQMRDDLRLVVLTAN